MAETDRGLLDDRRARSALDTYYGMTLGCVTSDLRRPGWTFLPTRTEGDPMALLFGQRTLVHLVAPVIASIPANVSESAAGSVFARGGVAALAPDLRAGLRHMLLAAPPERLYTPVGVRMLDALVQASSPQPPSRGSAAHLCVTYCARAGFVHYLSPWLDWIEPLDEGSEMDPQALGLLARFSGGVFVVRQNGHILASVGLRAHTPHVWEIHLSEPASEPVAPADTAAAATTRSQAEPYTSGVRQALLARATRAAFAAQRTPIFTYPADDSASQRLAAALGYRLYADASLYLAAVPQY